MARRRAYVYMLAVAVGLSCGGSTGPGPSGPWPKAREPQTQKVAQEEGLTFRLSEGAPSAKPRATPAAATTLDAKATEDVLRRLPPMPKEDSDARDFALREGSKPPPRAGKTVNTPFPPPKQATPPEPVAQGPLKVLRHAPDGEVSLAPNLSITFSQPMAPVTSVGDLARRDVPVKLSPEPPGKWRWLGTKTLIFEPSPRFPMATEYTVEIPGGTKSETGGALAGGESFRFATPPPTVLQGLPSGGPARREPVMLAIFDQAVDAAAVLQTIKVSAGGGAIPLRRATEADVKADPTLKQADVELKEGRWVAFRPERPLPPDAQVSVTVGPGTPSAEGPRTTKKAHAWSFRTFGALKIARHSCGWGPICRPHMPLSIELSNPIDEKRFDPAMVRVEPELPGKKVAVHWNNLMITGRTKGRTTYKVTLAPTLADAFGQTLEKAAAASFDVGPAEKALYAAGDRPAVLDPAAGARFSVYTVNEDALDVRAHAVGPEHWDAFTAWLARGNNKGEPPGKKVLDTTISIKAEADELTETRINLEPALKGGLGHVVLVVTSRGGRQRSLREADRDVGAGDADRPRRVRGFIQARRVDDLAQRREAARRSRSHA